MWTASSAIPRKLREKSDSEEKSHSTKGEVYEKKSMPLLYLFIERYKNSDLEEISRFANGLEKDIEAVENSVASELSNGFVEGTNGKLKMVKRTMYGRCSKVLLAAKVMYVKAKRYG